MSFTNHHYRFWNGPVITHYPAVIFSCLAVDLADAEERLLRFCRIRPMPPVLTMKLLDVTKMTPDDRMLSVAALKRAVSWPDDIVQSHYKHHEL